MSFDICVGQADWDTGYCERCRQLLSGNDRLDAITNVLTLGWGYYCAQCFNVVNNEEQQQLHE